MNKHWSYRKDYQPTDIVKVYNYCLSCKRRWYNSSIKLDFIKCPLCSSYEITTRIDNTSCRLRIPYFNGEDY